MFRTRKMSVDYAVYLKKLAVFSEQQETAAVRFAVDSNVWLAIIVPKSQVNDVTNFQMAVSTFSSCSQRQPESKHHQLREFVHK